MLRYSDWRRFALLFLHIFCIHFQPCSSSSTPVPFLHADCTASHSISSAMHFVCDIDQLLSAKERHALQRRLRQFVRETRKIFAESDGCQRRGGVAVGILLSRHRISSPEKRQIELEWRREGNRRDRQQECRRGTMLLFIPLEQITFFSTWQIPLHPKQLLDTLDWEKHNSHGHPRSLDVVLRVLEALRTALLESEDGNIDAKNRMDSVKLEEELEMALLEEEQKRERITQSFMLALVICACLFSLLFSALCFAIFYYVALVHDGGMKCWGDPQEGRTTLYYVRDIMSAETTMCHELESPMT